MFGKNVEDQLGAVDDARVYKFFDVALLGGREVVIEQEQIGRDRSAGTGNFFQLPASDQRRRVWAVAVLKKFTDYFRARADGQRTQLVERLFSAELRNVWSFRRQ
jgi:hypothetical protein